MVQNVKYIQNVCLGGRLMSADKAIDTSNKVVSLWSVIARNKIIFFSLYYSVMLFYIQYGNRYKYEYMDIIKDQMIEYNELIVFMIAHSVPVIIVLELFGRLIKRVGDREAYTWVSVLNIARKLEEIVWVLALIIAPVAYYYNTTLKEYWSNIAGYCLGFFILYIIFVWLHKKLGYTVDL